ncbi:MAG: hypothetical protein MR580_06505 [Anaerolactibacter massiliensis]|nr:hypothetical protein [Anaerolactibacter massiliensis]
MKCLRIQKGSYETEIAIKKFKFIVGNDQIAKTTLFRCIKEFKEALALTEYQEETNSKCRIFLDDRELTAKNANIIEVDVFNSLSQELKLPSKSLLQKSLAEELNADEYSDIFTTIDYLIQSICDQFNETHDIKLFSFAFTPQLFLKNVTPKIVIDETEMNEFDLRMDQYIAMQISILDSFIKASSQISIFVVRYPLITSAIMNAINQSTGLFLIDCMDVEGKSDAKDYCLFNEGIKVDLAVDEDIYKNVCENYLNHSDLREGREYMNQLITDHIYQINSPGKNTK